MATAKISDLAAANIPLAGTEQILLTQSGASVQTALENLPISTETQNALDQKLDAGSPTFSGTVTVDGDLVVNGSTTTINSSELTVDDLNIQIANGAADAASADGAGITIDGAGAAFTYDAAGDQFAVNKGLAVAGNILPNTDIAYDLGSNSLRFRDLYLSGSTIDLAGTQISTDNSGNISFVGADESPRSVIAAALEINDAVNKIRIEADAASGRPRFRSFDPITNNELAAPGVDLSDNSTDDVSEGSSNLYYTTTRANSDIDARVDKTFVDGLGVDASTLDNNTANHYLDYTNFTNTPQNVSDFTNDSGYLTDYSVTEADVTQHQTALSITESQISDLQNYLTAETVTSIQFDNATNTLSFTDENSATTDIDLSLYLDDTNLARLTSGTLNGSTGVATFTRDDATTFTVDFSPLFDDTNLARITSASFNSTDGVLTLSRNDTTDVTVDLDGRYLPTSGKAADAELLDSENGTYYLDYNNFTNTPSLYSSSDFDTDFGNKSTDNLSEGTSNLYFTDGRAQSVIDTNTAGFITDYIVTQGDVTQHQSALSITESQISDLQNYITDYTVTESDVTQHQSALSITESQISDLQNYITDYTVTESDVTQHQSALSITESQISDLQNYITSEADTLNSVTGRGNSSSNAITVGGLTSQGLSTFQQTTELLNTKTGATGTVVHDFSTGAIWYHSSISADFTANFTNVPTTADRAISVVLVLDQGTTGYLSNAVEIDGVSQTINWVDATVPSGTANQTDVVSFTLIRQNSNWLVLGSLNTFG